MIAKLRALGVPAEQHSLRKLECISFMQLRRLWVRLQLTRLFRGEPLGTDRTSLAWGSLLRAPTSSTRDHQPRDATRGRLRTPPTTTGKLRLTRRAWLLLWLTATLIALADGGLLLRGASVTVMVEGRSRSLPAGLTVAQVLERLELPAMGGDLLAVDHSVLRKNAYPPRVLVNGQPARATRRLHRGDR